MTPPFYGFPEGVTGEGVRTMMLVTNISFIYIFLFLTELNKSMNLKADKEQIEGKLFQLYFLLAILH